MSYQNPDIESSYRENDLGQTLYHIVERTEPQIIVEFGTLHGYSAIAMAQALKELGRGKVICYDLWNEYPFKHGTKEEVMENARKYGVEDYIELRDGQLGMELDHEYDMVHVDVSNTGVSYFLATRYLPKLVVLEGGTEERDNVEWMQKYNAPSIIKGSDTKFVVINNKFPGLSLLLA